MWKSHIKHWQKQKLYFCAWTHFPHREKLCVLSSSFRDSHAVPEKLVCAHCCGTVFPKNCKCSFLWLLAGAVFWTWAPVSSLLDVRLHSSQWNFNAHVCKNVAGSPVLMFHLPIWDKPVGYCLCLCAASLLFAVIDSSVIAGANLCTQGVCSKKLLQTWLRRCSHNFLSFGEI